VEPYIHSPIRLRDMVFSLAQGQIYLYLTCHIRFDPFCTDVVFHFTWYVKPIIILNSETVVGLLRNLANKGWN